VCIGKIYAYFVAKLASDRPKDMYKVSYVPETFGISGSKLSQGLTLSTYCILLASVKVWSTYTIA